MWVVVCNVGCLQLTTLFLTSGGSRLPALEVRGQVRESEGLRKRSDGRFLHHVLTVKMGVGQRGIKLSEVVAPGLLDAATVFN